MLDLSAPPVFASVEDYVIYRDHSAHQAAIVEHIRPHTAERAAVQVHLT